MRLELFISWRYLVTKRKEKFISLISVISVLGVAIGVAALIVVIAVMTGFDKDIHEKLVGKYAHIIIAGYDGIPQKDIAHVRKTVLENPHVRAAAGSVDGQILVKEGALFTAVDARGIEPEHEIKVSQVGQYLRQGSLEALTGNSIIIGSELAEYLGLRLNASTTIFSPLGKQHTLRVVGIFKSGMYEFDARLVFLPLKTAQEILGIGDRLTSVSLKLDTLYQAQQVKKDLSARLGFDYIVKTWMEINPNYFAALKLEKLMMFILLTIAVLVASFNIISTLIVMVVEKTKDIGILRALGMSAGRIRGIFTLQGFMIGAIGTGVGTAIGLGLCYALKKYQFIKLPQDVYYIETLPVSLAWWPDIGLVVICALLITFIATVYPAYKAAQLKPVEALRYE